MEKTDSEKNKGLENATELPYEASKSFYDSILPKLEGKKFPRPLYMIHEHRARRLHWDLRLEFDGVLESWALPKEPLTEEGVERLAVHVEPHPLLYGLWEGKIPEGSYGAGIVKIWDTGTFEVLKKTEKTIIVNLKGKRLRERYALVKASFGGSGDNWLFFKGH